jgi:phosphatidylglycerol:prolipoprotein diacylglycerol transferase
MSFHGALIGVVIACFSYAWIKKVSLLRLADLFAVSAPIGFFLGRIANFINGELFGRPTDVPWGIVFPQGGDVPRHPSQLYEALLEGLVMVILLFLMARSERFRNIPGTISATFLMFYGASRFLIEYVREPDPQLGLFFNAISMGQILCLPMISGGLILLFIARVVRRRELYDRTA